MTLAGADRDAPPDEGSAARAARPSRSTSRAWLGPLGVALVLAVAWVARNVGGTPVPSGGWQRWLTIFTGISVQAIPFLLLGVTVAGMISAFVTPSALRRVLPRRPALAVPAACAAGAALPGCECASVPISGRLMGQGVAPSAAIAFLLAAPAINPVVLVSTFVAFGGQPSMVAARFVAGLATALIVGWLWLLRGNDTWVERAVARVPDVDAPRWEIVRSVAVHDFFHAGGFLITGAAITAAINVLVPRDTLEAITGSGLLGILVMATLAVALSICSEADAFVAASLARSSPTAALAFMVVGPVVDVKLVSMQIGIFGRAFALRFAPLCFVVAVAAAVVVGAVLL